jgi:hypothetical protein
VTSIGNGAFVEANGLTSVYFTGNAPSVEEDAFASFATVYYLPGSMGWGSAFGGAPTSLWLPQVQASDASFGVRTNQFGFTISWTTNILVVVEASTNLANPVWVPLRTNTLSGGSSYFTDPEWTNYTARYYRVVGF